MQHYGIQPYNESQLDLQIKKKLLKPYHNGSIIDFFKGVVHLSVYFTICPSMKGRETLESEQMHM